MPRRTIAILAAASTLSAACSDGVCAGVGRPAFEVTVLDARTGAAIADSAVVLVFRLPEGVRVDSATRGGPERIAAAMDQTGRFRVAGWMPGFVAASALAASTPAPLRAQLTPDRDSLRTTAPAVGDRVRLDLRSGGHLDGTVARIRADTIAFAAERRGLVPTAVAVRDVAGFRRARGRDRARGARNGALVGGAVGVALVVVGLAVDGSTDAAVTVPATLLAVPAAGVLTLVGAGLGAAVAPTIWSDRTPLRVGASRLVPARRLATVGYRLRF